MYWPSYGLFVTFVQAGDSVSNNPLPHRGSRKASVPITILRHKMVPCCGCR